jgi:hypothetical protein
LVAVGSNGMSTVRHRYATLSIPNPIFSGFSISQRDNYGQNQRKKKIPGIFIFRGFFSVLKVYEI